MKRNGTTRKGTQAAAQEGVAVVTVAELKELARRVLDLPDTPANRTKCAREVAARQPQLVPRSYGRHGA